MSCACLGGAQGVQVCGASGAFDACLCPDAAAPPDITPDVPTPPDLPGEDAPADAQQSDIASEIAADISNTPDVPPDTAPDASPDVAPAPDVPPMDASLADLPDAASDSALDAASDIAPDAVSDVALDAFDAPADDAVDVSLFDRPADIAADVCDEMTVDNCCGVRCEVPVGAVSVRCTAGRCAVAACATGRANCNESFDDGCEADLRADRTNCGSCGVGCGRGVCASGSCVACAPEQSSCGTTCVNTATDPLNCGGCSVRCTSAQVCREGLCIASSGGICPASCSINADCEPCWRDGETRVGNYCCSTGLCVYTSSICGVVPPTDSGVDAGASTDSGRPPDSL